MLNLVIKFWSQFILDEDDCKIMSWCHGATTQLNLHQDEIEY